MTANWNRVTKYGMRFFVRHINGRTFTVRLSSHNGTFEFVCVHPDGWVLAAGPTADAVMYQADLVIQHALEGTLT